MTDQTGIEFRKGDIVLVSVFTDASYQVPCGEERCGFSHTEYAVCEVPAALPVYYANNNASYGYVRVKIADAAEDGSTPAIFELYYFEQIKGRIRGNEYLSMEEMQKRFATSEPQTTTK